MNSDLNLQASSMLQLINSEIKSTKEDLNSAEEKIAIFVDKNRVLESMNKKHCVILNSLTEDLHNGENPRT